MITDQLHSFVTLFFMCLGFGVLGAVAQFQRGGEEGEPDAKSGRRRKSRPRDERGLPDAKTLHDLAQTYLEIQCRTWPELLRTGQLKRSSNCEIERLVKVFEDRFLEHEASQPCEPVKFSTCEGIAAAYVRFSCDKSNPRSLVQQLKLILEKAAANRHFIPWQLVFADAGVSATTSDRIDYQHLNTTVASKSSQVAVVYIDEVGRASRDMMEALRLGVEIVDQGKHLLGVSDGFDSRIPMWKMNLTFCGMMHEQFVDNLRAKVQRGMRDAHERGTNLRPPAIGYKLVPAEDADGKPVLGRDGARLKKLVVDEPAAVIIREIYSLYAEKQWSLNKIARLLNDREFGDQQWDSSRVRQVLTRYKYVGIDIENMTRVKRGKGPDGKTKKIIVKRDRKEWRVRRARQLQIISRAIWKAVQKRLAKSKVIYSRTGDQRASRTTFNRSMLVRPICGCCKHEMCLGSAGESPTFTCLNGREGKSDCTYRGYKTARHIEDAVLNFVVNNILTDERVSQLVERANSFLKAEASRPQTDTSNWKAEIKSVTAKRDRLTAVLADTGTDGLTAVVAEIRKYEARLDELRKLLRGAEVQKVPVKPLTAREVRLLLQQARDILGSEVAQAAELLGELTGPVVAHLKDEPGYRRPIWTLEFTVNFTPFLLKLARNGGSPTASVLEYLNTHRWKFQESARIPIKKQFKYELIAPKVLELRRKGLELNSIAATLGVFWKDVKHALEFAESGKRPEWKPKKNRPKALRQKKSCLVFREIQDDVIRLREENKYSWKRIQQWLENERKQPMKVSINTIVRAYDDARRSKYQKAASYGTGPYRGPYSHIGVEKEQRIVELIRSGMSDTKIAAKVGVCDGTVSRWRKKVQGEQSENGSL